MTLDISKLLAEANRQFGETVDWDMRGTPITKASVLMHGAYGRAVTRLLNLALQRYGQSPDVTFGREQLLALAPEAFAQEVDRDFGGNIMTDYGLVLEESYGFGPTTLKLVQLALSRAPEFTTQAPEVA